MGAIKTRIIGAEALGASVEDPATLEEATPDLVTVLEALGVSRSVRLTDTEEERRRDPPNVSPLLDFTLRDRRPLR